MHVGWLAPVLVIATAGAGPHTTRTSTVAPPTVLVRTASLPEGSSFGELETLGNHLLAYGEGNDCRVAVVDAATLALSAPQRFDCHAWPPERRVTAVVHYHPVAAYAGDVRIGVRAGGGQQMRLGPTVLRFVLGSTSQLEMTYGGGALWLYDCDTPEGPQLVKVSAATGKLEARIRTPDICRPVIAAGVSGFWMGPAVNSTGNFGLYNVAAGGDRLRVVSSARRFVTWIHVSGNSTWIDWHTPYGLRCHCQEGMLVRYDSGRVEPTFAVSDRGLFKGEPIQASAVGDASSGLWTLRAVTSNATATTGRDAVVWIDPGTGRWRTVGLLPGTTEWYELGLSPDQGAVFHGNFYVLEPQSPYGAGSGASTLVRVSPAPNDRQPASALP